MAGRLGLAIVAAVAERFNGRLVLRARRGGGLESALYLPGVSPEAGRARDRVWLPGAATIRAVE